MIEQNNTHYLVNIKNILIYSLFVIFLSVLAYNFLDIPVAEWSFYNSRDHRYHVIWKYATYLQPLYYNISPWVFFYIALRICNNKPIKTWHKIFILMVLSMAITLFFNEQLRFIFGRYWPATWYYNNLSWIHHKAYGFNWFESNHSFKSFPSGHTSLIFGFTMVLWWLRNDFKTRMFVVVNCLAVALGLILMCYHFVSDVLIGALVGTLVSYITVYKAHNLEIFKDIYR